MLNGVAATLLVAGRRLARAGRLEEHKCVMIGAFGVSTVFLVSYLTHKWARDFENTTFHAEGLAKALFSAIAQEVFDHDPELAMKLQPALQGLIKRNDYHEYGGAPLLGVNGTCLICHGSSKARTIKNAVRAAAECVRSGVNEAITERVAAIDEHAADSQQPA